jgi:hypothetical protein
MRLAACQLAGVEPHCERLNGHDAEAYIWGATGKRRQMSKGQMAMVAAKRICLAAKQRGDAARRRYCFDRSTHQPGHHGGAVGHTALQVLHALVFDFLNYASGRLDPSYAAIGPEGERV